MSAESFVDTNVLIYAACGAFDYPDKHRRAWEIIGEGNYAVSGQVMAEFYVNSMSEKKQKVPLKPNEAFNWLERLSLVSIVPIDGEIVRLLRPTSIVDQAAVADGVASGLSLDRKQPR